MCFIRIFNVSYKTRKFGVYILTNVRIALYITFWRKTYAISSKLSGAQNISWAYAQLILGIVHLFIVRV